MYGWAVTWKGRGWDRSFDDYLALVRAGRDLTRAGRLLVVPSVKYHLPKLNEPFRDGEYRFTTQSLAAAWGDGPLHLEKDFSPTLAGDPLAAAQDRKSTRLNSSHQIISYAAFCLKKKKREPQNQ